MLRTPVALIPYAFLAAFVAAGTLWHLGDLRSGTGEQTISAPAVQLGGPFALTDQNGKRRTDEEFRGKYMLVFFGYTYCPDVCPTTLAVISAALDMMGALRTLNAKWRSEGKTEWRVGIGLNHGQAIVGDMGSQKAKNFGVLGDAINLGSRLEGQAPAGGVVIAGATRDRLPDDVVVEALPPLQVKGKAEPVVAYVLERLS